MRKLITILAFALLMVPAFAQNHTDYRLPDEPNRAKYIDFPSLDKGLWFAVQLTPAYSTLEGPYTVQADFIAGYRTGEFFKVGAGVSPKYSAAEGFAIPVFLDLRGNLISQESRMAVPYWNLDAGYTFGSYKGLYVSPTVGVRVGMPRNNFIAGLTYILQQMGPGGFTPSHSVGLRIGYEF
ncbi:MAG: hypothetical protein J6S62_00645 [Bacteroidales bacterium]|nr:hypothetical protein [Bacteroidales bacterium]